MKKTLVSVIVFLLSAPVVFAQLNAGITSGVATGQGLNVQRNGIVWSKPSVVSEVVGEFFEDSLWHTGTIIFYKVIPQVGGAGSDVLDGVPIRYNVFSNEIEVLADKRKNDIRAIPGRDLKNFTIKKTENDIEYFSNVNLFKSGKEITGFFKTLTAGKLTLMKHYYARKLRPNYNLSLNVGEKNTTVSVEDDYYVVLDGKAEKISLGKKMVASLMKDKESEMNTYVKLNEINFKREEDIIRLFEQYNK